MRLKDLPLFQCVLAMALMCAPLSAQGEQPSASDAEPAAGSGGVFFDSVDVRLVNLEVLVTDDQGEPVTGLKKSDFIVTEDKQPVELSNFFAVENRNAINQAGELSDQLPATRSLLLVVYVDNLNILPQNRNRTFASLRKFIQEGLDPSDRVMIVSYGGQLEMVQNFTNDADKIDASLSKLELETGRLVRLRLEKRDLLRRINRAALTPRPTGASLDVGAFEAAQLEARNLMFNIDTNVHRTVLNVKQVVNGIKKFTESLAGLPGRKAVLYISDGIPSRPGEDLVQAWRNQFESWAYQNQANQVLREIGRLNSMPRSTMGSFRSLVEHASAHRVTFYPISNSLLHGVGRNSAELAGASTANGQGAFSPEVLTIDAFSRESSMMLIADGTGGRAYTRSSNLRGLMEQVVKDFSSFYSLGYLPASARDDKFHKIKVTIKDQPRLDVRYFKGYRELDPIEQMENLTLSALYFDVEDNPLDVSLVAGQYNETAGGTYRVPLLIRIPFENLALLPQEGVYAGEVLAFVIVQDERGNLSPFQRIKLPIRVPASRFEEAKKAEAGYQVDLVMRKGRHRVSVGIRDVIADLETTVNLEVSVGVSRADKAAVVKSTSR